MADTVRDRWALFLNNCRFRWQTFRARKAAPFLLTEIEAKLLPKRDA